MQELFTYAWWTQLGMFTPHLFSQKTKVSPIKRLSIPRLELCGAQVLTKLLCHAKEIFQLPMDCIYAWTDSTIVLSWLSGNPR